MFSVALLQQKPTLNLSLQLSPLFKRIDHISKNICFRPCEQEKNLLSEPGVSVIRKCVERINVFEAGQNASKISVAFVESAKGLGQQNERVLL